MTNGHMKRCSMSLLIREMHMKPMLHPLEWLLGKKKKNRRKITSVDEDVKKWELLCVFGRNVKWCIVVENSLVVPEKVNIELPI